MLIFLMSNLVSFTTEHLAYVIEALTAKPLVISGYRTVAHGSTYVFA
ncbi:MAG TPA: hypothetical protein V6D12_00615 [Candidatus Obscuribacterales bacterium]